MRGRSNIIKALEQLDKKDIASLILFTIFKLKDKPEYSTLSELAYLLDGKSFANLLNYYGGKTITIPTVEEFNDIVVALLVMERRDNTGESYENIFKEIGVTKVNKEKVVDTMMMLHSLIENSSTGK